MLHCRRAWIGAILRNHFRRLITTQSTPKASTSVEIGDSTSANKPPRVIFSGIQPTGVPHLGNYFGALREWVKIQNAAKRNSKLIFSLVDLHAITVPQVGSDLQEWKRSSLAMLLAIGLDPERCTLFYQSDVPAHAELMWILACRTPQGVMSRQAAWKDKTMDAKTSTANLKLGLFSYPVLQAADILLYRTTHVPVGEDQRQHLEFARHIAGIYNRDYGKNLFVPPIGLISPAKRIKSLRDPKAKMSKSNGDASSRILLTDSTEQIRAKIKSAVTDSIPVKYDPIQRPGVSNLIDLIFHCRDDGKYETPAQFAQEQIDACNHAHLKDIATVAIDEVVRPIRERHAELMSKQDYLDALAAEGAEKARHSAAGVIRDVKRTIGLSF